MNKSVFRKNRHKMGKSTLGKSLKLETYITRRKLNPNKEDNEKNKRKDAVRKVSLVLQKCETSRTAEDLRLLESFSDVVRTISNRKARAQLYKDRVIEKEDPIEVIERKSKRLAQIISRAKHLVCYTGAGISTSAKIPDYRGSHGIWTLLQQGKEIGQHDLSLADPTYTHMALYELHRRKMMRFIISQNCDGLHLRAGLPKTSLSEVHGNMYIEVCKNCKPNVEYWRLFDTTELTARYCHKTNRRCHICNKPLSDTIVHFGERGNLKWPLNWAGACAHSEQADVILCLGSSLKVLKKYSWLWQMDRPIKKRAKICIINLQWTPKDKLSTMKINGKCDEVMRLVMKHLNINVPIYTRERDPIFSHASLLCTEELHTVSQPMLRKTLKKEDDEESQDIPSEENDNENELTTFTSSDSESRSTAEHLCSENSNTPKKSSIDDNKSDYSDEVNKKPVTPVKNPILSPLKNMPVKSVPYVKTSLNSKHLLLAETEQVSSSEGDDTDCEDNSTNNDLRKKSCSAENIKSSVNETCNGVSFCSEGHGAHTVTTSLGEKLGNDNKENQLNESQILTTTPQHSSVSNDGNDHENSIDLCVSRKDSVENGCTDKSFQSVVTHQFESSKRDLVQTSEHLKMSVVNPAKFTDCPNDINNELRIMTMAASTGTETREIVRIQNSEKNLSSSISSKAIDSRQNLNCDRLKGTPTSIKQSVDLKEKATKTNTTSIKIDSRTSLTSDLCMLPKQSIKRLNDRQLYGINSIDLSGLANSEGYYRNFFEYCRAVEEKMPYWYDVGYAYSGLHSIIQPPPPEIDLWSSTVVPIFNMNKNEAECEFCFENYAEFKCQFYYKYSPDFAIKKYRNDKLVACECCDYTDDETVDNVDISDDTKKADTNADSTNKEEKRAKLDIQVLKEPAKIQAGWYGKGYRKNFRRRKR